MKREKQGKKLQAKSLPAAGAPKATKARITL